LDLIVMWSNPESKLPPTEVHWVKHTDVWFMEAVSKITRKTTYPHVLNFLVSRNVHDPPVEIFVDGSVLLSKVGSQSRGGCAHEGYPCTNPYAKWF